MVFAVEAPKYWERGLSVIPVLGKRPVQKEWNKWALELPGVAEQEAWLQMYSGSEYGIGLVCGPASGLCAVDIDSDDERIIGAIERALPESPWHRVGRRGKVLVYKYRDHRNFSIKDSDGKSIVDVLSLKKQFVLPPSIHPDTGKPYWANRELLDVLDAVRSPPSDLGDVIRAGLKDIGIEASSTSGRVTVTSFVSAGNRDVTMMKIAGLYSKEVVEGQWTFLQQIDRLEGWIAGFTEQVWNDSLTIEKAVDRFIYCLRRDVFEYGKTLPSGWDEGITDELRVSLGLEDFDDSRRRWSAKEILDSFNCEVVERGGLDVNDDGAMSELVEKTIAKIAQNQDLTSLEEDRLLRVISDTAKGSYRIVSLRKRVNELRVGERKGETHADVAEMMVEELERDGEIRWHGGYFWQWVGSHWDKLDDAEIRRDIIEKSKGMPSARKSSDYNGIFNTMVSLRVKDLCQRKINGVNFVNGYLTEDLDLLEHDKDFGCTYCIEYPYSPELKDSALVWEEMLHNYWGEDEDYKDKVQGLREAMAATLFGVATRYQRAFLFKGISGAGKTRIITIMKRLMPAGTGCSVPPEKFGEKFESTDLAGKLFNEAGELSDTARIPSKYFKMIIEGSELQGQFKNKPVFHYQPMAAHWFGSNVVPKADSMDSGFLRRWLIFRFDRPFPPEKRVPDIVGDVLREDKEALMAWAIEGIKTLKANQEYHMSKSHHEEVAEMVRKGDSVRFWIGHLLDLGQVRIGMADHSTSIQKFTSVEHLFRAYRLFSSSTAGVSHVGLQRFVERMVEHGTLMGFSPIRQQGGGISGFMWITLVADGKAASG